MRNPLIIILLLFLHHKEKVTQSRSISIINYDKKTKSKQSTTKTTTILDLTTTATPNDNNDSNNINNNIEWKLYSQDLKYQNIPVHSIPGDIITDLYKANIISNPYNDVFFLKDRNVWMGNSDDDRSSSNIKNDININKRNIRSSSSSVMNNNNTSLLEERSRTWVYEATIKNVSQYFQQQTSLTNNSTTQQWVLVLEGIKMGASIYWNDQFIGNVTNQFRKYMLKIDFNDTTVSGSGKKGGIYNNKDIVAADVKRILHTTTKRNYVVKDDDKDALLRIVFDPSISTNGRFMACSGGWDWAPYTKAGDERNSRVFTFGIIKPLYIIIQNPSIEISHVIPKIYYLGKDDDNEGPMIHGPKSDFLIDIHVHLYSHIDDPSTIDSTSMILAIKADFLKNEIIHPMDKNEITFGDNVILLKIIASKESIKLWWPNGYGTQTLYSLDIQYRNLDTNEVTPWITKRIGFRTIALITSSSSTDKEEGSGSFGMYFKVNGAVIYIRGANMIPLDQLEGRINNEAYRIHVKSAADSNMNMLRVWGGGIYYPSTFYETCDELGILLYHDLMYVSQEHHNPTVSIDQELEIRNAVRDLSSYVCIVLWSGCNECDIDDNDDGDNSVYIDFVMTIVAQEDNTRIIWPSSPSKFGWETGVYRHNSKPNGNKLSIKKQTSSLSGTNVLEVHGPYNHGSSDTFMTVNCHLEHYDYDTKIPIQINPNNNTNNNCGIGSSYPNTFISEFGISSISSFESMSSTLTNTSTWGIHGGLPSDVCIGYDCEGSGNVMSQRNYPCDNHIIAYFGPNGNNFNLTGTIPFQRQLYQCMISTMLWIKSTIEEFRSGSSNTTTTSNHNNPLGLLLWQFNEIWPTGGWGLVEYGSYQDNNNFVLGGRWKPIMYILKRSLFQNIFATCGKDGICYIRNDGIQTINNAIIYIELWNLLTNKVTLLIKKDITIHGGGNPNNSNAAARNIPNHHPSSSSILEWFSISSIPSFQNINTNNEILVLKVMSNHNTILMDQNIVLYQTPQYLTGLMKGKDVILQILSINYSNNNQNKDSIDIHLYSNTMVLFVVLTTKAQGRFSDNAFVMKGNEMKKITFQSLNHFEGNGDQVDIDVLRETLRVEHLGMYV